MSLSPISVSFKQQVQQNYVKHSKESEITSPTFYPKESSSATENKQSDDNPVYSESQVKDAVSKLNKKIDKISGNHVQFEFEKKLGIMVVNTVDKVTGEVIGSSPPKDIVQAKIQQFDFIGSLLNKKG